MSVFIKRNQLGCPIHDENKHIWYIYLTNINMYKYICRGHLVKHVILCIVNIFQKNIPEI